MPKMTLKQYAVKHKMSMFTVVKRVKNNKVKSETVEENGKNVVYILEEDGAEAWTEKKTETQENRDTHPGLLSRMAALENEMGLLRKEIESLKKRL
ncbi:hypothetical protein MNB_SV-10-1397 [hydrothermal vent metagenome]|uniref:Uncharacterized protein n=1 Tax=hydrothermal vent metagenome TaxID=652676 RepID=A0A1W1BXC0_9ZZZZ